MRFFWLNFHVNYACRHSGACCSAGWPIPVERDRVPQIQQVSHFADWLVPASGAPGDVAGTLALGPGGHCVFHGNRGCGVYSMRPASCAHFPYVCLIDQRGVHVTLSHYCPTAAAMLFDHDRPIEIVEGPAPPTGLDIPEGLDAREALPPLASPNLDIPRHLRHLRLMSFDEFSAWEQHAVKTVSAHMAPHVEWPEAPETLEDSCVRFVAPAWPAFEPVIARYLAAKAFASWAAYLNDDGTAAVLRGVESARAVLHVEAARQCARADRILDAPLLKEAIRQSDLRLVHDQASV
jgi:Fe-S-cluster containining protein